MAIPIRSWSDGYAALRRRAGDMRGWIELETEAPDRRWPRTTGLDVIVIASFIDKAFQSTDQTTYAGTALRWQSCKDDLERDALPALNETYRGNREFWPCLAMMCSHLSWVGCPVPPQAAWRALLDLVGAHATATRNADPDRPPVWFANAGELDDLYRAQRSYLGNLHGFDRMAPEPDMRGGVIPVPRSTNGEVLQLAAFWSQTMQEPKAKNTNGYADVLTRWNAVMRDVEAHARGADPDAVYPHNHRFWRGVQSVAIHTAASIKYGPSDAQRWMASVGDRLLPLQQVSTRAKQLATAIAEGIGDVAAEAAHGAGKIVHEGARGLLSGLATPLLIGGGVVATVLLLRARREPARGEARS